MGSLMQCTLVQLFLDLSVFFIFVLLLNCILDGSTVSHLATSLGYQKQLKNLMYLEEDFGARSGTTAAWVSCSCTKNREIDFCVEGKIGRCRVADGPCIGQDQVSRSRRNEE